MEQTNSQEKRQFNRPRPTTPSGQAGAATTAKPKRSFGGNRRPHDRQRRPAWPKADANGTSTTEVAERKTAHIPNPEAGIIRVIPLGGVEEIGKNMTAIEIGDDIIVIDAGMSFANETTPGIDYVIPNTRYLEERKDKIRAMIITHGHLDHIGGVPLVLSRIGNPPVYSRNLTVLMLKKRHSEFPHLPPMNTIIVENNETITMGALRVKFWGVTHTIPDSMGIIIETPHGNIVNPGDYKLDQVDGVVSQEEEDAYKIFDTMKTLLLFTDSTNIENEGFSLSESKVHIGLENILRRESGHRIIVAAFSSTITRLIKIIEIAEMLGKHIFINGRSMRNNIDIAMEAGLLKPQKDTIQPMDNIDKYPPHKVIVLTTGGQGEEFSGLMRAANKTDKKFALKKGDTVILSSSIVPGNERQVEKMKDGLSRQGTRVITYRTPGEEYVHATGHGNKEDIKWLHRKIREKFFIPIHGNHYRLQQHKDLAMELGVPESNIIVPDNGSIIEISADGEKITMRREKAPATPMMVDGFSVGDEQSVVIRDRQMLAEDGMFVVVALLDSKTGLLKKSPDIISRGFVYLKENQDLLRHARVLIKRTIEQETKGQNPVNFDQVKNTVADIVSKYLYQHTAKRPLVIPVILSM
ncbi:MAG: rnjA [Candidatus Nomurabacteria bacterium]|nr:rnjA [Candidatus Nomurabacteria bacterium]